MGTKKKYFYAYRDYFAGAYRADSTTSIFICGKQPVLSLHYCDPDHSRYDKKNKLKCRHANKGYRNVPDNSLYVIDYGMWRRMARITIPNGKYALCSVELGNDRSNLRAVCRMAVDGLSEYYQIHSLIRHAGGDALHFCYSRFRKLSNVLPEYGENGVPIKIVEH